MSIWRSLSTIGHLSRPILALGSMAALAAVSVALPAGGGRQLLGIAASSTQCQKPATNAFNCIGLPAPACSETFFDDNGNLPGGNKYCYKNAACACTGNTPSECGNGNCDGSGNCAGLVACAAGQVCNAGVCQNVPAFCMGGGCNAVTAGGPETQANCCEDCGCPPGT